MHRNQKLPFKKRSDLELQRIEMQDGPYMVVRDPLRNQYNLLTAIQYAVFELLDGESDPEHIRKCVQSQFAEYDVTSNDIARVAVDLCQFGIVSSTRLGQTASLKLTENEHWWRKLAQACMNPLFIRFPGIDPTPFSRGIRLTTGWLFSIPGFILWCCIATYSTFLVSYYWSKVLQQLPSLESFFTWPNLLYLWLMVGLTKVIHELGHASACYRFGRRCEAVGVSLLLFLPTLYCNANDSWMLRSKWSRIAVSAAGMYFELLFAFVAAIVWIQTGPGLVHYLALNVVVASAFSTVVINANPLVKFDGYYMLMDFVRVPNLQQRATRVLEKFAGWCWGYTMPSQPEDPRSQLYLYVMYSILASAYRWTMFFGIVTAAYYLLLPYKLSSLGIVVGAFSCFSLIAGGVMFGRRISKTRDSRSANWDRRLITISFMSVGMMSALFLPFPVLRSSQCVFEPEGAGKVDAPVAGTLTRISESFTHFVEEGELIAELADEETLDRIDELKIENEAGNVRLQMLIRIGDPVEIFELTQKQKKIQIQLEQLEQLALQFRVLAPRSGTLVSGERRAEQKIGSSFEPIEVWSGRACDAWHLGAPIERGTSLARVFPDQSISQRAVLVVSQDDAKHFREGDQLKIRLYSRIWESRRVIVKSVSSAVERQVPKELSSKVGGHIETDVDADGNEQAMKSIAQIEIQMPENAMPAIPGTRGRINYWIWHRSFVGWVADTINQLFTFG